MDDSAKTFLQYDYAETKELCKHFLTLVVAVLVFSLTFSEKIIDFPRATKASRVSLMLAWCFLLASIITCGIGLTLMTLAAGDAVYSLSTNYPEKAQTAYLWIVAAGCSFVTGLLALMITAIIGVLRRRPEPQDG